MKKLLLLLFLIPNLVMAERKDCKFDCSNCNNYEKRLVILNYINNEIIEAINYSIPKPTGFKMAELYKLSNEMKRANDLKSKELMNKLMSDKSYWAFEVYDELENFTNLVMTLRPYEEINKYYSIKGELHNLRRDAENFLENKKNSSSTEWSKLIPPLVIGGLNINKSFNCSLQDLKTLNSYLETAKQLNKTR